MINYLSCPPDTIGNDQGKLIGEEAKKPLPGAFLVRIVKSVH